MQSLSGKDRKVAADTLGMTAGLLAAKWVKLDYRQKHCAPSVFLKQWAQIFHYESHL